MIRGFAMNFKWPPHIVHYPSYTAHCTSRTDRRSIYMNDFLPTASWENLRLRAELLRRLRDFFHKHGIFLKSKRPFSRPIRSSIGI